MPLTAFNRRLGLRLASVAGLTTTLVKARFQVLGLEPLPGTPNQMARYAATERERWGQLIRDTCIKLD